MVLSGGGMYSRDVGSRWVVCVGLCASARTHTCMCVVVIYACVRVPFYFLYLFLYINCQPGAGPFQGQYGQIYTRRRSLLPMVRSHPHIRIHTPAQKLPTQSLSL